MLDGGMTLFSRLFLSTVSEKMFSYTVMSVDYSDSWLQSLRLRPSQS
jgi:hypothetical protein